MLGDAPRDTRSRRAGDQKMAVTIDEQVHPVVIAQVTILLEVDVIYDVVALMHFCIGNLNQVIFWGRILGVSRSATNLRWQTCPQDLSLAIAWRLSPYFDSIL